MKKTIVLLPLLLCSCAANLQHAANSGSAIPLDGVVEIIGQYDPRIAAGSAWVDRYRDIYLVDRSRSRVLSYQWAGDSCAFRYEIAMNDPESFLVPGYDGGFCLADIRGQRLVFYSFQGSETGAMPFTGRASSAAITAAGDIFLLDAVRRMVTVHDARGILIRQFPYGAQPGAPDFKPSAMAASASGDVLALADPSIGLIVSYSSFGRCLGSFKQEMVSLAFDTNDRLWIMDAIGRLSVFGRRNGMRRLSWPDSARTFGYGAVIAAGPGAMIIAGNGEFVRCH